VADKELFIPTPNKREAANQKRRETTAQKKKRGEIAEQALTILETIYSWFFAHNSNKIDASTIISVLENAFATAPKSLRDYLSRNQPTIEEEPVRRSNRVAEIQHQKEVLDEPPPRAAIAGGGSSSSNTSAPPPPLPPPPRTNNQETPGNKRPRTEDLPKPSPAPARPDNMANIMAQKARERAEKLGYNLNDC